MDLDFHLDDADKPAPARPPREPEHALAEMHAHGDASPSAADRLARPAAAMELDKLDLSFDPDKATFEDPFQYPVGIDTVLVNGQVVLDEGKHTNARPGQVFRRTSGTQAP